MTVVILILSFFLTPCEFEDSTNCYWDSGTNQQGSQFIDFMGTPLYLEGN